MKISPNVTLCPVLHPRLYRALFPIRVRSRAEVIRRYAEIGLLFEMGMLNFNVDATEEKRPTTKTTNKPSNDEDKYDDDIIEIFGISNDDDDMDEGQ